MRSKVNFMSFLQTVMSSQRVAIKEGEYLVRSFHLQASESPCLLAIPLLAIGWERTWSGPVQCPYCWSPGPPTQGLVGSVRAPVRWKPWAWKLLEAKMRVKWNCKPGAHCFSNTNLLFQWLWREKGESRTEKKKLLTLLLFGSPQTRW